MKNKILNILKNNNKTHYIELTKLQKNGEMKKLCPEIYALDENVKGHKNNFYHTMGVLKNVCESNNNTYEMRVIALFHDIGKPKTKKFINNDWTFHGHEELSAKMWLKIVKRWNITDEKFIDYTYRMIKFHGRTKMPRDINDSAVRRFTKEIGIDIINDLMDFCKCDITTKFEDKRLRFQSALDVIRQRCFEVEKSDEEAKWRSPLTGEIIMKTLNIKPGKLVGDIKKKYDPLFKENKITLDDAIKELKNGYINR